MSPCCLCHQSFTVSESDLQFYQRIGVPIPKLCPDDRQRRRAAFRNERNLYSRTCDGTGRKIVSMYSPDKPYKVYDQEYFWGDEWSALDFGRPFDFDRPFFEQFRELQLEVPRLSLYNVNSENSYYTNHSQRNKNCYMGVDLADCEDVYYSNWVLNSKDCIDCSYSYYCELCYFLLDCKNCFQCDYCQNCEQCSDCYFSFDCQGCHNCFGCAGLRNKEYFIFNKYVGREEFQSFLTKQQYSRGRQQLAQREAEKIKLSIPHRFAHLIQSENSTGDYLYNCKNALDAYDGFRLWDCKYMYQSLDCKDAYDCYEPGFEDSELIYEIHAGCAFFNCKFLHLCQRLSDCEYCDNCFYSKNLFGCVGLKYEEYCIFNKKYSKQDYETLLPQIINHMKECGEYGEFFPFNCSPFGYNESNAQDYFPLEREEALSLDMLWSDYQRPSLPGETVEPEDDIRKIEDSITDSVLQCVKSGKKFKIINSELKFYRKKNLPIPNIHTNIRYAQRMAARNPRTLWERTCDKCSNSIISTYLPNAPEQVFCEKCYLDSRF